jgi:hypothetical protein
VALVAEVSIEFGLPGQPDVLVASCPNPAEQPRPVIRHGPDAALLAECFEELGGVPGVLLTDRIGMRASTVAYVVVPHPEYVQFCAR